MLRKDLLEVYESFLVNPLDESNLEKIERLSSLYTNATDILDTHLSSAIWVLEDLKVYGRGSGMSDSQILEVSRKILEELRKPNLPKLGEKSEGITIKINLKVDREVNFLMILYQSVKNQNSFENLCFEGLDKFNSKDKEKIKDVLRSGNSFIEGISRDEKLKDIYLVNKEVFERYWNDNIELLGKIKNILEEKCNSYDFSIFEKVERFFDFEGPREVDIYLCLGNETMAGTGNAFSPNLAFLFPRDFKNYSKETVDADFAVLIHEVMHLFQNMCNESDSVLREKVAQCFAPRGILINEDRYSGDKDFFEKVKSSFCKGKTYSDIREDLLKDGFKESYLNSNESGDIR